MVTLRYFQTDHLGSVAVITDAAGVVTERLSYDAWGKRRYADGADDPTGSIASQTTRGFTGQEELAIAGLVHMNGRVYDSMIGRMTSADPIVPDALNAQAWNRYSYVGNSPLDVHRSERALVAVELLPFGWEVLQVDPAEPDRQGGRADRDRCRADSCRAPCGGRGRDKCTDRHWPIRRKAG